MEIVQPIPTRAKIARAWLEHAHSFDPCVHCRSYQTSPDGYGYLSPELTLLFLSPCL